MNRPENPASHKIAAIIECRMRSIRLPGKVMLKSYGKPMLEHMVERLSCVKKIDALTFATTENESDDCIEELAQSLNITCYRGSEEDVLRRDLLAAQSLQADIIVEVTGDCPLIDPEIVSQTLDLYLINPCDFVSNDLPPSFPMGMDVEIFSTRLLQIADREGKLPEDREHVSWFFVRSPERFRLLTLPAPPALE